MATSEKYPGLKQSAELVLDYLLTGKHLSNMIAFNGLGVGSLTSRVSEINYWIETNGKPWGITADWKKDHFGKRYKSYALTGND